jgi:hypothetical protein
MCCRDRALLYEIFDAITMLRRGNRQRLRETDLAAIFFVLLSLSPSFPVCAEDHYLFSHCVVSGDGRLTAMASSASF